MKVALRKIQFSWPPTNPLRKVGGNSIAIILGDARQYIPRF